jgi:hypothetical protein
MISLENQLGSKLSDAFFYKWVNNYNLNYSKNSTNDGKNDSNPYISFLKNNNKLQTTKPSLKTNILDELLSDNSKNYYSWNLFNESKV